MSGPSRGVFEALSHKIIPGKNKSDSVILYKSLQKRIVNWVGKGFECDTPDSVSLMSMDS